MDTEKVFVEATDVEMSVKDGFVELSMFWEVLLKLVVWDVIVETMELTDMSIVDAEDAIED